MRISERFHLSFANFIRCKVTNESYWNLYNQILDFAHHCDKHNVRPKCAIRSNSLWTTWNIG